MDKHGSPQVVLDILVENAGRVNYGVPLESRKGTLISISYQSILSVPIDPFVHCICTLHPSTVSVHYIRPLYLYATSIHCICTLHPSTVSVHYIRPLYLSTTSVHCICTLHPSTVSVHYIRPLYLSTTSVHCICPFICSYLSKWPLMLGLSFQRYLGWGGGGWLSFPILEVMVCTE